MKKLTAKVATVTVPDFEYLTVSGYEVEAWGARMIVTKEAKGYWQVYDIESGIVVVKIEATRDSAVQKLKEACESISEQTYKDAKAYWMRRQGMIAETEQSISFGLNKARLEA